MKSFVTVTFRSLTVDKKHNPVMVFTQEDHQQELLIAVNSVDANRLAIASMNILKAKINNLSGEIITALGGSLERITLEQKKESQIQCYLHILVNDHTIKVEARPGEGVLMGLNLDRPILAEKGLYKLSKDEPTLAERVRSLNTQSFGLQRIL